MVSFKFRYFQVYSRGSAVAAASILREMSIRNAKSVRFVFIIIFSGKYDDISSGFTELEKYNEPD